MPQPPPRPSVLTFSNSPMGAGQLVGSWHTHMGVLLSSNSHTLPCLQWWFWQGSGRVQGHVGSTTQVSTPTPTRSRLVLGQKSLPVPPTLGCGQLNPPFSSAEPRIGI